jgi:hypothetical protein
MGGCTALSILGGGCYSNANTPADPRVRAGFGRVPFVGGVYGLTPFGTNYSTLASVTKPFHAVYAANDTNVPRSTIEAALPKLKGSCVGVVLAGETHSLSAMANSEADTYEILFFDAWLRDNAKTRATIYGTVNVEGGVNDQRTYLHSGAAENADGAALLGSESPSARLLAGTGTHGLRIAFPTRTDGTARYDLVRSDDLLDWECLRAVISAPKASDILPPAPLPAGFQWRVLESNWNNNLPTPPLYLRVRACK